MIPFGRYTTALIMYLKIAIEYSDKDSGYYGLYLRIFTAMSLFKVYAHTSASSKTIQFKFTGTKSNRTVFAEPACYQPRLFEHPLRGLLVFLSLLSQRQLCCSDASHISLIIAFIWLFPQKRRLLF